MGPAGQQASDSAGPSHAPVSTEEPHSGDDGGARSEEEDSSSNDGADDGPTREDAAANLVKSCQTERVSRTRRTDFMLALSGLAAESLRRQLGGGHTRLVHARRKHGDG